jgi:biotin synthase
MKIQTKAEVRELLTMPWQAFQSEMMPQAEAVHRQTNGNRLVASALLGFDNICRNRCLYCGMRAGQEGIVRYRIDPEKVVDTAREAYGAGLRRIFLISGEDPGYPFADTLRMVGDIKALGFHVSLALGELEKEQYAALREAGADTYVLKFEMAQRAVFERMKPSTTWERRMRCIEWIVGSGMALGSGNIVDYPGQTLAQLAEDILLMQALKIDWAPIIPYLPAKGTPLALEGGRGSLEKNLREIAILRLMMPHILITAQQPGEDPKNGLADPQGNLNAIHAGADILFADLLPAAQAEAFRVVDNRITLGMAHIRHMAERAGRTLL